ncbi:hypothetical protein ACQEU8_02535 [Streptomyces sp. CA-250714]|uniref:hypothetical protein n=1 Tax=Streptomyces sp. CA-250714 TaxID=3240060 RepID=UPI003D946EBA
MTVNNTFRTYSGTATVSAHAVTRQGTIRVGYWHAGDPQTAHYMGVRTFTQEEARKVGLIS